MTFLTVALDPSQGKGNARLLKQHMTERLLVLQTMGLAEHGGSESVAGTRRLRGCPPSHATQRRPSKDAGSAWRADVR